MSDASSISSDEQQDDSRHAQIVNESVTEKRRRGQRGPDKQKRRFAHRTIRKKHRKRRKDYRKKKPAFNPVSDELTERQINVIMVIARLNRDGSFVDLDQLLARVRPEFKCTKQAMQFCLRRLAKQRLIMKHETEIRRKSRRVLWSLTMKGYQYLSRMRQERGASAMSDVNIIDSP